MHPARLVSLLLLLTLVGGAAQAADTLHLCRSPTSGLIGFGDRICRIKVPYRYVFAEPFSADGLSVVTVETTYEPRMGVVDRTGKEVLPAVYRRVVLGPDGQILATRENPACPFHPAPTMDMLFDAQGHPLLTGDYSALGFFREGLATATPQAAGEQGCVHPHDLAMHGHGLKTGYVDRSGRMVVAPQFDEAYEFTRSGLAGVSVDGHWGFIDKQGKRAVAVQYGRIVPQFNDFGIDRHDHGFDDAGLARVEIGDGVQLIDTAGHAVGPGGWWRIGAFNAQGLAPVSRAIAPHTFRSGLMDVHGKVVAEPTWVALTGFVNGYAAFASDKDWGFVDAHGTVVVAPRYEWVGTFGQHGVVKVRLHPGRDPASPTVTSLGYGFIDAHGAVVLDKDDYDTADDYQDEMDDPLARVTRNGKVAYVDVHGKVALGWFEAGTTFGRDGLAAVKVNGRYGYVDRTGRFAIAPAFDGAARFDGDTLALAKLGTKWGMIDHAGKVVVPFEFDHLAGFAGSSITLGRRGGRDVAVDRLGHVIDLPPLGDRRGIPVDDL